MSTATAETGNVAGELPLDLIAPEHWPNPRGAVDTTSAKYAELKASIEAQGILEPIVIGPPLLELDGRHAIVAGWRRYTVAAELGLQTVPVHQKIEITDARLALRAALAENMAREDMTPLAEAQAIARLVELGDTQVQAATAVGVSERTARERLRLLTLPAAVRDAIAEGKVPSTAGRQLQLIADASEAAATWIAEGLADGSVRAGDLLDEDLTSSLLAEVCKTKVPFERVGAYRYPHEIADKALAARLKAIGGTYTPLPFEPTEPELAAGRRRRGVLDHGQSVYVTDADLILQVLANGIERLETAKADRDRELKRQRAKVAKGQAQDPSVRANAEREALEAAAIERARPYAAAMNEELGRKLRGMNACAIEGPVARLLLSLLDDNDWIDIFHVAEHGYGYVDPERAEQPFADGWPAGDPQQAAAELIRAFVAAVFCDPRANGDPPGRLSSLGGSYEELTRDAAIKLKLLPDRALRLDSALISLHEQQQYHRLRTARRRILFDLTHASKGGLEAGSLCERVSVWGRDAGDLVDVAMSVNGPQFDTALEQLIAADHVKSAEHEGKDGVISTRYTLTAAGRKELKTPPGPAPILDDIDAGSPPADLPDGTPATDELQDDANDLMSRLAPGSRRATALELVAAQPGITIPELAERMGLKQNTLYRLLPELQDDGLVRKDGRGWHPAEPIAEASP